MRLAAAAALRAPSLLALLVDADGTIDTCTSGGEDPRECDLALARQLGRRAMEAGEVVIQAPENDISGVALPVPLGAAGALCLVDADARGWISADVDVVRALTSSLTEEAEMRAELEALRRRAEAAEAIVENLPDIIARFDLDLRHIYVNGVVEEQLGIPPSEFLGKTHAEFGMPEPLAACWHGGLSRVLRTGRSEAIQFDFPTPRGPAFFECRITAERGPSGEVESLLAVGRDITELERARSALREGAERYRAVFEQSMDAVFITAPDGTITDVNDACLALFGWARDDSRRRTAIELYVDPAERRPLLEALEREGSVRDMELRLKDVGGRTLDCLVSATILRSPGGEIIGYQGIVRNITERKRIEHERLELLLREKQARAQAEDAAQRAQFLSGASDQLAASLDHEATLRSLPSLVVPTLGDSCIVYLVDDAGRVTRLEPAHADPEKEALVADQLRRHPATWETLSPPVVRALRYGLSEVVDTSEPAAMKALPGDTGHTSIAGALGLRSLLVIPLRAHGRIIGAISYGSSDPERPYTASDLALGEELARRAATAIDSALLYDRLRRAVSARDQVLQVVSHDLRSPLTAVLLSATTLLQPPHRDSLSGAAQDGIRSVVLAAEQMNRLIEDLVDVARIEAGHLSLERFPEDIAVLARKAVTLNEPLALRRDLRLAVHIDDPLPPVPVAGERILQVLSNLLGNAIKFTPAGGEVTLRVEGVGEEVRVSVSDTGIGIAEEHLPQVFDRFWQARSTSRGGAGLGLAIARGIVESHGGRISAESTQGQGSTFSFLLPAPPAAPASEPVGSPFLPELDGGGRRRNPRGPILIVDDDAQLRGVLRNVLERDGYTVVEAENGAIGVRLARMHSPALVLMDMEMPVMTGPEAAAALRSHARTRTIPLVALAPRDEGRTQALFDDYVAKPASASVLLGAVHRLVRPSPGGGATGGLWKV